MLQLRYKGKTIREGCRLLMAYKMYPSEEDMMTFYLNLAVSGLKHPVAEVCVLLTSDGEKGVAASMQLDYGLVMVWVSPKHRRKGYGNQVVASLTKMRGRYAAEGEPGSLKFWEQCRIKTVDAHQ
jgi:ribosomal protein S18 acetylase RimI-like enzyme